MFANNPAMCAVAEVMRFQPDGGPRAALAWHRPADRQARASTTIKDWGLVEWAKPILDVVFDGVSDAVDYQLQHALDETPLLAPPGRARRDANDDLDDANVRTWPAPRHAEQLIADSSAAIDAAIAALT